MLNASVADQTGLSIYAATKAALRSLARGSSAELIVEGGTTSSEIY